MDIKVWPVEVMSNQYRWLVRRFQSTFSTIKLRRRFPSLSIYLKFSRAYAASKARANRYIEDLYKSQEASYSDRGAEKAALARHKSRIVRHMALQSLSICAQNYGKGYAKFERVIELTALQILIGLAASWIDDFHDEYLVPYLATRDGLDLDEVLRLVRENERLEELANKLGIKAGAINPIYYVRAYRLLGKFYAERLFKLSPDAARTYEEGRRAVEIAQARDILLNVFLKRNDFARALSIVGDYRDSECVSKFLSKLGIVGGEAAVIVNQASWQGRDIDKEAVNEGLRHFYTALTNLGQVGVDDLSNVINDIKSRSPNIFILAMLSHELTPSMSALRDFIQDHPDVVSVILRPITHEAFEGLLKLGKLNFAFDDCVLAFLWMTNRIRKAAKRLENLLRIKLDWSWDQDVRQLAKYI